MYQRMRRKPNKPGWRASNRRMNEVCDHPYYTPFYLDRDTTRKKGRLVGDRPPRFQRQPPRLELIMGSLVRTRELPQGSLLRALLFPE